MYFSREGGSVAQASLFSNRVGVVHASPRGRAVAGLEDINQTEHGAVGAGDHEECADDDDEAGPADHELPPQSAAVGCVPVVVEPHGSHGLETHEGTENGSHEGDEATESGDAGCDAVGDECNSTCAAQPSRPVLPGVCSKMLGASQDAYHEVFCGELVIVSIVGFE